MSTLPSFTQVEEKALSLGFTSIAQLTLPVLDLDNAKAQYLNWLKQGLHADMQWMLTHKEIRLDPQQLMPTAKSILCVTINYNPGAHNNKAQAKIARYAVGKDYHKVVKKKLKALLSWLQSFDETLEGRALVDSAPILEKALAVKAGLGWQGKHSCLITKSIGSWVFLGELFLSQPLSNAPVPEVLPNFCGNCTRCISACPTQAITAPMVVDSNKCIAYWTIESKADVFPQEIKDNLNEWLFGCDICQDVCPWNIKFEQPTTEEAFRARPITTDPNLQQLLAMGSEEFNDHFNGTPFKRIKLQGLHRNAQALLGQDNSHARQGQV